jgi:hypothetical protein
MEYLLVLVVLGAGGVGVQRNQFSNAAINQPMRVGQFRSLESCQAAAIEAAGIGLEKGSFGFVCVRSFAPSDLAVARGDAQRTADDPGSR